MDSTFTAIAAMLIVLMALSTRKASSERVRRGRLVLLAFMAAFVGVSYYLSAYVSATAASLWSIGFWIFLAAWGYSLRDRGLVVIGVAFAALYFVVSFAMPLLLQRPA